MSDHPRVTDGVMDLLVFLDNEVEGIAQALTMASDKCAEAAVLARNDGGSAYAPLFEESAVTWKRKAERLMALAEHIPDVLDY
jgi:hypothetical protein